MLDFSFGRKTSPRQVFLIFCLFLTAFFVAGCKLGEGESQQVLRMVSTSEPRSFDPYIVQPLGERRWSKLIFSGLWKVGKNGEVKEDLAFLPVFKEGGRRVEVRLKENLKWSDGKPLTAEDVDFTWKVLKGKVDRDYQPELYPPYSYIEKVEVKDGKNLVFYLKKPFYQFGYLFPAILPKHVLGKEKDIRNSTFWLNPVGSGPYRLKDFRFGQKLVFEANPFYFGFPPKIKRIEVGLVSQDEARKLVAQGKADLWQDITEDEAEKLKKEKITLTRYPVGWQSIFLNSADDFLSRLKRRQAILAGVNWRKVRDFLKQKKAGLYGLPPLRIYNDLIRDYRVVLNRPFATQILISEGYKHLRKDGLRERKKSEYFAFYLFLDWWKQFLDKPLYMAFTEVMNAEARRSGMDFRCSAVTTRMFNAFREKGGTVEGGFYQLLAYSQTFYPHPLLRKAFSAEETPALKPGGLNFTFYSSGTIEENYQKAEASSSLAEEKRFLKEVYREVNEQALLVPLGYSYFYCYVSPRLKGYEPPLFWETSFSGVESWELE